MFTYTVKKRLTMGLGIDGSSSLLIMSYQKTPSAYPATCGIQREADKKRSKNVCLIAYTKVGTVHLALSIPKPIAKRFSTV